MHGYFMFFPHFCQASDRSECHAVCVISDKLRRLPTGCKDKFEDLLGPSAADDDDDVDRKEVKQKGAFSL